VTFPLVPIAVIIAALLAAKGIQALWPKAKGKRITVTGVRGVGKTTLATFLKDGSIPAGYAMTMGTKTIHLEKELRFKDLKLKVDTIADPAGDREAWQAWLDVAKDADLLIYLINYASAKGERYVKKVHRDTGQIALWRRTKELRDELFVVVMVTHCDRDPAWASTPERQRAGAMLKRSRTAPAVVEALSQLGAGTPVVAGSLATPEDAVDLAYRMIEVTPWKSDD
jgi:hypothetical protein